ncbi:MAG: hypothetical protein ACKOWF_08250 [Chloroflexota bacterium]
MSRGHPASPPARALRWLPFVAACGIVARRMAQMGPLPSGLDGGEWLAIGRGLLGGEGRVTNGAYALLIPAAADLLAGAVGPVPAIRLLAAGSLAAVLLVIARIAADAAGPAPATAAVIAAGSASAITEPFAFGGYPQHFAFAAGMAGVCLLARFLDGGGRTAWLGAAAAFALAALCHHIYFPASAAAAGAAVLAWWCAGTNRKDRLAPALRGVGALLPGAALAAPTLAAFRASGYSPPLDAASFGLAEAWRYSTREGAILWALVVLAGAASLAATIRGGRPATFAAAGLMAAGGAGFLATAEPRMTPMLLAGALLACVAGLSRIPPLAPARAIAARAAVAIPVALLAVRGDQEATAFVRFYRVLDTSTIAAAGAIDAAGGSGAAAIREDRRGWPLGWWYEGLTRRDVLVGSDPRWLGFPGEREQAAAVAALFDGTLPPAELRRRAGAAGVGVLACRKWEWIGWERWLAAPDPAVEVLFDDDETIVLRVRQAGNTGDRGV